MLETLRTMGARIETTAGKPPVRVMGAMKLTATNNKPASAKGSIQTGVSPHSRPWAWPNRIPTAVATTTLTLKANPWLRATLVEAVNGASRTRDTYLAAQYRRLAVRLGRKKAVMAVAYSILVISYHMLDHGTAY